MNPSGLVRFLDRIQIVWLSVRRSLGALLAVITLLVIAGIVAMVVLQQRQTHSNGPDPFEQGATIHLRHSIAPKTVD